MKTKLAIIGLLLSTFVFGGMANNHASTIFHEGIIHSPDETVIERIVRNAPTEALVIFDIGNVLLAHEDVVFKHPSWRFSWFKKHASHLEEHDFRRLYAFVDRDAVNAVFNPALPKIIEEGKSKCKVIALSKYWIGPCLDTSFEGQRVAILKQNGIDFGEPFPATSGWQDTDLKATYSQGIILTEAPLKGPVLEAFLKQIDWQPEAIIFVDDRKDQCESIAAAAKKLGIPTVCIHYTEAIDNIPPLDITLADLQLRTLIEEERWLSDKEARIQLIRQKDHLLPVR